MPRGGSNALSRRTTSSHQATSGSAIGSTSNVPNTNQTIDFSSDQNASQGNNTTQDSAIITQKKTRGPTKGVQEPDDGHDKTLVKVIDKK